ncbi:mucoidy inhibitor MuiA family protein [Pseudoduganella ginsengisoli]|uniref:Mucoidy inhibitor MuiA family protein n=1 Tax=Pseudoduganella ginsengisoli TaxID=1462440 RepID=A0A6L6Q0E9_9BURK|nr:mucoidy inhibitor MuiA family protein [Pseudoduganella ginsengisoli]MTW03363.1 mucoidy inhibitor MuiA family protein [Pseudoduganella ginsengisoli]
MTPIQPIQPIAAAVLLLCVQGVLAASADAPAVAPITAVTVYPGSATVERVVQIKAGQTEVEIAGLPANFDARTVRVQASNGIQLGQIVTRDVSAAEAPGAREAELEQKIQALRDSREVLEVDVQAASTVRAYLEKLPAAGEHSAAADGKAIAGAIDAVRHGARDTFSQIQRTQVQLRDLDRKIAVLVKELSRVRSGARDQRRITVSLAARQGGTLRLSYQVNGAGWKPAYRALLDTTTSRIDLERMAVVSQRTGEDWSGVALKLSTGQPRLSPQAPEPEPRLLKYYPPTVLMEPAPMMMAPASAPAPVQSVPVQITGSRVRPEDLYVPPVLETQGNFDTEFNVPDRADLASDGREVSLPLSRLALPVAQRIRATPAMDKSAFLMAEAERPAGVWLSGDVQLFRDGAYVGNTHWNSQATEKLQWSFGRDELVRVTVDRAGQQTGSSGFLSKKGERDVTDVYTIASSHKTPVALEVLEAAPVSTSDEVKVEAVFEPQPAVKDWERRQGVVAWQKTLAPGETMKIKVRYTIRYPKEGGVTNLP